jgi:ABC-type transport system involved in multi-copper enzyme maturation permease subunit
MIWLTWRQFRAQALTALAVLGAVAITLLITGLQMRHTYTADLHLCTPQNDCDNVLSALQQHYSAAFNIAQLLVLAAPGLIGAFWGAPLIARELETGTHQVAWNQTVTRTRWLTVKLAGVGAASIITAGLLSYLLTWWAGPLDHISGSRFAAATFATRDIVPLSYAAFAFVLGTTIGLLLRRSIPAMALTLGLFIGIQILMPTVIRPHLLHSATLTYPINSATASRANGIYTSGGGAQVYIAGLPTPQGAWVISAPPIETASGHVVPAYSHPNCFTPPPADGGAASSSGPGHQPTDSKGGGPTLDEVAACVARYDLHETVTYQPASHYWPLQWYETGIFSALAAALSGICFWRIRRQQN